MRLLLPNSEQGYEFNIASAQTVQEFPLTPGACEFFLNVNTDNTPSARRNSPPYPGRNEVINVVLDLVAAQDEVIATFRPKVSVSRVSLSERQCSSIEIARRFYRDNPGTGSQVVNWRVWCPIGLTILLYRFPVSCIPSFLYK